MKNQISCPHCYSKSIIRKGARKNIYQEIQLYNCKQCHKTFSTQLIKKVKYPVKVILKAISFYNLGCTQNQVAAETAKSHHVKVPQTTISEWINKYKEICTFHRLREQAAKLCMHENQRYPEEMIFTHQLQHNQIYKYQLHRAKLQLIAKELLPQKFQFLKAYLEKIPTEKFPHHIFQPKPDRSELNELARSSQIKFETLEFIKKGKQNQANQLAKLAINLANSNKQRHEAIQNFMLINDSTTIAAEVPVYLTNDDIKYFQTMGFRLNLENYQTPITGHIDILQIRNGIIHILDYKPEADKINATEQLTIYALALASRTKLALRDFKCAWFDENNYYEFFPLHAVYEKR